MKRGLDYLFLTLFTFSTISYSQPIYAGETYREKCRRDTQKTVQSFQKIKKSYEKICDKIDGPNPQERGKDIAGEVIEQSGIPGAREMIEIIDKGPNYQPPWKRKR